MSKVKGQKSKFEEGQLILEILIVIMIIGVVVAIGSQIAVVSMQANKLSLERDVASGLSQQMFEAIRSIATENWVNIYEPADGKGASNHYSVTSSGGKWIIASGDNATSINGISYTQYFTIDNISRDPDTSDIESAYNASNDDPSTQKITVHITWGNGESISFTDYISRWRNKLCEGTNWISGATTPTDNVATCSTSIDTYFSDDGNIDVSSTGSIQLKTQ
jgi:type II secretory pathway pseudopilin PulG